MKLLILVLLSTLTSQAFSNIEFNEKCSLANGMTPECYHKRQSPILNIALFHYGEAMEESDLERVSELLKSRFAKATQYKLTLEITHLAKLPLAQKMPKDFKFNNIKDPKRLHRIWYYENVGSKVLKEGYDQYKKNFPEILKQLDVLLIITEAQFNALGFAYGRISATEYPMEVAWALPSQGRTEYPNDYRLVDELIHEIGHNMFLGHAAVQCQKRKLSKKQKKKCIENSPSRNDVMSYSRARSTVSETVLFGFEQCNMGMIEESIIPNILNGGPWNFKNRVTCK